MDVLLAGAFMQRAASRTASLCPYYSSPEQATAPADARSDVYAMGCLAWELLANRELPQSAKQTMPGVVHDNVPRLDASRRASGRPARVRSRVSG